MEKKDRDFSLVIGSNQPIDWRQEFLTIKEYSVALERSRADLMGSNEELRDKIKSLEHGQEDLVIRCELYRRAMVAARNYILNDQNRQEAIDALTKLKEFDWAFKAQK